MTYMILFLFIKMVCMFLYIDFKVGFIFEALYCTIWIYLTFLLVPNFWKLSIELPRLSLNIIFTEL